MKISMQSQLRSCDLLHTYVASMFQSISFFNVKLNCKNENKQFKKFNYFLWKDGNKENVPEMRYLLGKKNHRTAKK